MLQAVDKASLLACVVQSLSFPSTQRFQHPFKHCQLPLYIAIQSQPIWLIGVISLIWNISKITKQRID